jgi:hypothetical protein
MIGTDSVPASLPAKWLTNGPGDPLGAAPSTKAAISGLPSIVSRMTLGASPCYSVIAGFSPDSSNKVPAAPAMIASAC